MQSETGSKNERSFLTECKAIADMKFTYVVSCQNFGIHKRRGDTKAQDILKLMSRYSFPPFVFSYYVFISSFTLGFPIEWMCLINRTR